MSKRDKLIERKTALEFAAKVLPFGSLLCAVITVALTSIDLVAVILAGIICAAAIGGALTGVLGSTKDSSTVIAVASFIFSLLIVEQFVASIVMTIGTLLLASAFASLIESHKLDSAIDAMKYQQYQGKKHKNKGHKKFQKKKQNTASSQQTRKDS